ncbi:putative disease resistance protein (TIR-NBS-LRR class), partial [Trifolium medium]|nr:putative disease resistance protein (TIR-NBS-LRR class) [Trifolium medium]
MEHCHVVHEEDVIVSGNDGNNVSCSGGDTVSLLYEEPLDIEMEHCHVVDEEDVVVSGYADNNVSGSGG